MRHGENVAHTGELLVHAPQLLRCTLSAWFARGPVRKSYHMARLRAPGSTLNGHHRKLCEDGQEPYSVLLRRALERGPLPVLQRCPEPCVTRGQPLPHWKRRPLIAPYGVPSSADGVSPMAALGAVTLAIRLVGMIAACQAPRHGASSLDAARELGIRDAQPRNRSLRRA